MPSFGKSSKEKLATAHSDLQAICWELIKHVDCRVICGHRSEEKQLILYESGASKVRHGKHNETPSEAVDVAPYPITWGDTRRFCVFAGQFLLVAKMKGIVIRWGGDWSMDGFTTDQEFNDLVHFELI